ncbi:DUF1587 domain-containing protein, partial [bacterium]|nr:DUF1587 domain-containing protein [bacterium]
MIRVYQTLCRHLSLIAALTTASSAFGKEVHFPEKHAPFIEKYCFECHDAFSEEGEVNLEDIPYQITTIKDAELWQKVLNAMNSGDMPPDDEPQPANQEKADFLQDLANTMVEARKSLSDSGGEITMRRLNRREYRNTIEQLLGVEVDVSSLPSDGGGGTFDTVGSSQFISSDQIEQYLKLGRSAIDNFFERHAALQPKTSGPRQATPPTSWKERREVEELANIKVDRTYHKYLKGGYDSAQTFLETGKISGN